MNSLPSHLHVQGKMMDKVMSKTTVTCRHVEYTHHHSITPFNQSGPVKSSKIHIIPLPQRLPFSPHTSPNKKLSASYKSTSSCHSFPVSHPSVELLPGISVDLIPTSTCLPHNQLRVKWLSSQSTSHPNPTQWQSPASPTEMPNMTPRSLTSPRSQ